VGRTTPWLPSSGVGPILGDGRPSPHDIIRIAEEQAELERLAQTGETVLHLTSQELPREHIPGITLKLSTKITKAKT
jgi:hypothetical protein